MALAVLVQTGRAAAEATVERLQALGIEAQVLDEPNVFVKLTSGGNYRVRVVVAEEELERARAELVRWESEALPRLRPLTREVQILLGGTTLAAALLGGALLIGGVRPALPWAAGLWVAVLAAWVVRSRMRAKGSSTTLEVP